MLQKRVYLFGFDKFHRPIACHYIPDNSIRIATVIEWTWKIVESNDEILTVYALDGDLDLTRMYWEAKNNDPLKSADPAITYSFEDYCCSYGLTVYIR